MFKPYLPLVHKIAFANKFQLNREIKQNVIHHISLHIKRPQSIFPKKIFLNNELMDLTTAGRLFYMKENPESEQHYES